MSAKLWETGSINAFSTTLNGAISDTDVTIALTTTTGLVAPGIICVDRTDANGTATPTKREYISFTGISTNNLTGCTRGVGGSTAQAHNSGANVEENFSVTHWGEMLDFLQVSHDTSGNIVTGTATISTARIITHLNASGASVSFDFPINPIWVFTATGSTPTTGVGKALYAPNAGLLKWFSITLSQPASGATLIIDVNKDGSSIFDAGTRLMVPGGGTYASTASISTKSFSTGNRFTVDIDQVGQSTTEAVLQGRG